MRLRSAVSLTDFIDADDDEVAGWRQREARKDRRRRRRDEHGRHRPRDERGFPPRRASRRREEPEPEPDRGSDEDELVDLFDAAIDHLAGGRRRRGGADEGSWSRAVRLSRNLRVQAAQGYRAAVMELRPGLYLVAEMPEEVARSQFGLAPLLAPLMLHAASRVIRREDDMDRRELFRRRDPVALPGAAAPQLPGPVATDAHAASLGWVDPVDVAEVVGCDRCRGRCG